MRYLGTIASMDRRSFLQAATASTVFLSAQAPAAESTRITSSVMLWTLQGAFERKLEIAAQSGLESVELVAEHIHWTDAQIGDMKKLARSLDLGMDTIIAQAAW